MAKVGCGPAGDDRALLTSGGVLRRRLTRIQVATARSPQAARYLRITIALTGFKASAFEGKVDMPMAYSRS